MSLSINIAASLDIEKQSIGGTAEFDYTVLGDPLVAFTRNTATQGNPTATTPVHDQLRQLRHQVRHGVRGDGLHA